MVSGGLSGAVGKFTGALGDLTAKLTGDDEYQEQRRRTTKLGENLEGAAKVSHSFYHTAHCFDLNRIYLVVPTQNGQSAKFSSL